MNVQAIVAESKTAAYNAADKFFNTTLGGQDQMPCGFAWVTVEVKGSTKIGKELLKNGFRKPFGRKGLQMWNPSKFGCQNVDTVEAGAVAAAKVLEEKLGVVAYAGSRWD